ncbi:MAG: NADH-ubiquinone oxidoreductase chain 6, partial [Steroidobacteraceae bacterium]|nr:NADH-ubiquinone oxidoreductase chain 6 [Steroidobacteraceae bacterium]
GFLAMQWGVHQFGGKPAESEPAPGAAPAASVQVPANTPDIYYIILDGYARADTLAKYYDYDNGPFLDGLRARGFQVSQASHSNYYWTFLSLASSLNFEYMQPMLGVAQDPESTDRNATYQLLRDNRAAAFLRARGYRFAQLQSTWGGTGTNPFADDFIPCHSGLFESEYLRAIADASWLRALNARASMDVANCHLHNLETLADLARRPGPKFVFAHFVPPHHPYLFDREGHVLRRANLSDQFEFQKKLWEQREPYRDQLIYMNDRITAVVDRLLAESGRPPIIILQSDHGPNLRTGLPLPEQRRIRMSNFAAFHLPGAPTGLMPDDETPVNQFRRIFNHYFSAGLPLLPDRYFASTYLRPYEFVEVDTQGVQLASPAQ